MAARLLAKMVGVARVDEEQDGTRVAAVELWVGSATEMANVGCADKMAVVVSVEAKVATRLPR